MVEIALPALADVFTWALLIMALAAGGWIALFTCRLTMASARACSAIPVLGIALPALYRLVAVRLWPVLWLARESALLFAFVALAAAGLMFCCIWDSSLPTATRRFKSACGGTPTGWCWLPARST